MRMNDRNVLQAILEGHGSNQRELSRTTELSLGAVNNSIKALMAERYINDSHLPTPKATKAKKNGTVKNAVILAAGQGLRLLPINRDIPKGLIKIGNEPLIERLICQLHSVGVTDITIVLGYMMERYEYLEDKYGVNLIVNNDYEQYNNLYSLRCVEQLLGNTYIVPCDLYFQENPFHFFELDSWYMAQREEAIGTTLRVLRSGEIEVVDATEKGNVIVGLSYLSQATAIEARKNLLALTAQNKNGNEYWEAIITSGKRMIIEARYAKSGDAFHVNTYEDLRQLDFANEQLENDATITIQKCFGVTLKDIDDFLPLKNGLTNRSLRFTVNGQKYIIRIPGEGTENYINRVREGKIYEMLRGKGICTDLTYFDAVKGFKITPYIDNVRPCDETNPEDVRRCMTIARKFHDLKLSLGGEPLDIFNTIQHFEDLWEGKESGFADYNETKKHCMAMKKYVEKHHREAVLSHQDCTPDNFILYPDGKGGEKAEFIDWECGCDADPLLDVASFVSYRKNDRNYIEMAIDAYFPEGCLDEDRLLIYCYISLWGLYISVWCEYKKMLGERIGQYMLTAYYYAKTYYRIFESEYKRIFRKPYDES